MQRIARIAGAMCSVGPALLGAPVALAQCPTPDVTARNTLDALNLSVPPGEPGFLGVDEFGRAVAVSGRWGAAAMEVLPDIPIPQQEPAVALLYRYADGWRVTGSLRVPSNFRFDGSFAEDVAMCGDWLAVSAPSDTVAEEFGGAVVFFRRGGGRWIETQQFRPADQVEGQEFGRFLSMAGDVLAVGGPGDLTLFDNRGSAYVLTRVGSIWTQAARLVPGAPLGDSARFGERIATDGRWVAVSRQVDPSGTQQGFIDVYERANGWALDATLAIPPEAGLDTETFARSVSVEVSGRFVASGYLTSSGPRVVVWERSPGGEWAFDQVLSPNDLIDAGAPITNSFGRALAMTGDTLAVQFRTEGATGRPGYRVYREVDGVWSPQGQDLAAPGFRSCDRYDKILALDGDRVLFGDPEDAGGGDPFAVGGLLSGDTGAVARLSSEAGGAVFSVRVDIDGESTVIEIPVSVAASARLTGDCAGFGTVGLERLRLSVEDGFEIDVAALVREFPGAFEEAFGEPLPPEPGDAISAGFRGVALTLDESRGDAPRSAPLDPADPSAAVDLTRSFLAWEGTIDLDINGTVLELPLEGEMSPPLDFSLQITEFGGPGGPLRGVLENERSGPFEVPGGMTIELTQRGVAALEEVPACEADLDGSGAADFFDVIALTERFATKDPAVDRAEPFLIFDTEDVVAVLRVVAAGCP